MPLPEALRGELWAQKTARTIFPILVWCAKNGRTVTYSELDQLIVSKGWGDPAGFILLYRYPAGAIGNALLETEERWGERIPPLNALIVSKKNGVPGEGCDYYLKHFLGKKRGKLTKPDRKVLAEAIHEKIFNFTKWDKLLKEYDLKSVSLIQEKTETKTRDISRPVHKGWSNEGESPEHKALKHYVAGNSDILGINEKLSKGDCEYVLASSDRPDIMFSAKKLLVAVEVKSGLSNDADLQRGIFQCVKYRAVIRAEQKARKEVPNGRAILVTERFLPDLLKGLADLLDVPIVVVKMK